MDVTEVDAATIFGTSISGGPTALGASPNFKSTSAGTISGAVGFITGGAQYQEAPTVRYQPLSGQALIAQVSTPMTAEALSNLYSSDWSLAAVLALSIDRLTPNYMDFEQALNAILHLDKYGAITIAATPADSPAKNDNLTIYFRPKHFRTGQASCDSKYVTGAKSNEGAQKIISALWKRLKGVFNIHGDVDFVTLSTKASAKANDATHGHAKAEQQHTLIQTRSALGVLKAAAEPDHHHYIAVMKPEFVRRFIDQRKNSDSDCIDDFYSLDPKESLELDELEQDVLRVEPNQKISDLLRDPRRSAVTVFPEKPELSLDDIKLERALEGTRRFMLIAVSDESPSNAFVSVRHNGKWYYIFNDDRISKRTLALITQIDTMLAVPSQSPSLTPSISVGAR
jgi:hypothetical protein